MRLLAQSRQFVFQFQFSVLHSTGIEEGPDGFATLGNPIGQLFGSGPVFFNIAVVIRDGMLIKETPCFTAGPSWGVTDKKIHKPAHFLLKIAGLSID